jgi:hypothetical protein
MKNGIFWDAMSCGSCKNRHYRGRYHLHHQGEKNLQARNNISRNELLVANNAPSSLTVSTLMMEVMRSS